MPARRRRQPSLDERIGEAIVAVRNGDRSDLQPILDEGYAAAHRLETRALTLRRRARVPEEQRLRREIAGLRGRLAELRRIAADEAPTG